MFSGNRFKVIHRFSENFCYNNKNASTSASASKFGPNLKAISLNQTQHLNPAAKMMMSCFYYLGLWRGTGKIDPGD